MALVHEKLYSSEDLAVVEFRDYARELARSLFVSYGVDTGRVRLTVKGAGFVLPLDRAIPAALIVNETVSNALKHAFPDDRSGEVSIRLIERSDCYVIEITDDGVGIPPDRAQTGATLGTRLIRRLASQMGATIEQAGPGTVYRLTLPKENGE
jgi:two-component sensor histidine kinase